MNINKSFQIENHTIGRGHPCFIIAEIAQAHDGSLGSAFRYIEALANTGVNAIKFQTHIADAESTPTEAFRIPIFPQDKTRYDYWKRMEFTTEQWSDLAKFATEKGLIFLSTPFSLEAVDLLENINIPAWKVGSAEITHTPLLDAIAQTNKPVLLSTGLCNWQELDNAINLIEKHHNQLGVFQCTSSYPCQAEDIGLNVISELISRLNCPVGLSDHSGDIYAALAAVTLGANMIEVHSVFSKQCFGPDTSSSLTIEQIEQLVKGIRFIEKSLNNPVDKNDLSENKKSMQQLFRRSMVAAHKLNSGHTLSYKDIAFKKPADGLAPDQLERLIGNSTQKSYKKNEPFLLTDFNLEN